MSSPSNNQCLCKEDGFGISRTLCPVHGPVASNNLKEAIENIITDFGVECMGYLGDKAVERITGKKFLAQLPKPTVAATQALNLILDTILAKLHHAGEKGNPLSAIRSAGDQKAYEDGLDDEFSLVEISEVVAMLEGMR